LIIETEKERKVGVAVHVRKKREAREGRGLQAKR
jgi:hypothetical protein